MHTQDHFQAQPGDIFLCSPMKTSCTWLKALSFSIATRAVFDNSNSPLQNVVPHDCIPMLEFGEHYSFAEGPKIPLFASHLPYTCLPKSEERQGKIQGIIRFCSFESLSNSEVNKSGKQVKKDAFMENSAYFRKGEVGDWRNYLAAEMGERLDNIVEEKLSGSGSGFTFLKNHNR
ncbi:hypothetical protein V6N13_020297 [Hibiscus sabdariffa]|uniref:Sulfotransferase n=1 Tax=Hibiscus sabdariffa TaxID=183260 RepID=A0ABR2EVS8_9ROSI